MTTKTIPYGIYLLEKCTAHLPDFWKVEALKTVGETLEDSGNFRLRDLVYSFDPRESHDKIES